MKFLLLWFVTAFLLLPKLNDGREYYYNRPQVAFLPGETYAQRHQHNQQQKHAHLDARSGKRFVVGGHGTQFDVHMVRSQPIYVGYQAGGGGRPGGGNYAPQQPYATQHTTARVNPLYPGLHLQNRGPSFAQQSYQQQQQQEHGAIAAIAGAYGRSIDVPYAFASGPASGGYSNNGPRNGAQFNNQFGGQGAVSKFGGHGGGNAGGQIGGYSGGQVGRHPGLYSGGNSGVYTGGHSGVYAGGNSGGNAGGLANTYTGGISGRQPGALTGGGGNHGGVQGGADALSQSHGGNFVSQSEASELDHYPYKQLDAGDPRAFERQVTVCFGNGQCKQMSLAPGEADPNQFRITTAARGSLAPVSDKCKRLAAANLASANAIAAAAGYGKDYYTSAASNVGGGEGGRNGYPYNSNSQSQSFNADGVNIGAPPSNLGSQTTAEDSRPSGPNRPRDRRLYPYSEVPIRQDPFN